MSCAQVGQDTALSTDREALRKRRIIARTIEHMISAHQVAALCRKRDGVARTRELLADGASRFSLRKAVRDGVVERLLPGVYVVPELEADRRAALLHGGERGCASAAQAAGLWVMPFDGVHVWLTASGHEKAHSGCQCVAHWNEATAFERGRAVLHIDLVLQQIALCQGEEAFFVALESALFLRKISALELARVKTALPRRFSKLFELAHADSESGLESLLRYRLDKVGLTVQSQVTIAGVGRVDFVVGDCLIIEADGKGNHEAPEKRHKDHVRDAVAAALGFNTLRFDYAMILHDWATVEAAILGLIGTGAHMSVAGLRMRGETRRAH